MRYILPFYHTVSDVPLPHLRHLYKVKTTDEFKRDLDFFCRNYKLVDLNTFGEAANEGFSSVRKPICHLSFDDGLKECYNVIAQILIERNIPATFFINSAFVDNQQLFYRLKISILIEELFKNHEHNKQLADAFGWKNPHAELLKLKYTDSETIEAVAAILTVDFDNYAEYQSPYMSSDEVKKLVQLGFTIGGHSVDHPEFRYITVEEQKRQVEDCMKLVDQFCNQKYKVFSFPFTDFRVNSQLFDYIKQEGIVDMSFGTAGYKPDAVKMNFQRVPMETGLNARCTIGVQQLKSLVRKVLFINMIQRG
jgi:peptidoglycan/xylan/chitin deacetylase (PgdA/CDA1 family)